MKGDVPANPVDVGLLRPPAGVPGPECVPHPVEELLAWTGGGARNDHLCVGRIEYVGRREIEGHACAHAGHDSGPV